MAGAVKDRPTAVLRETHDESLGLSENSLRVLSARYLKKDEDGHIVEAPAAMFQRVARTMADVEVHYGANQAERDAWEERFFDLMVSGQFMPNSPTLMNSGREMGMLSACFVLPVRDSINDIFDTIKHTALIQKAGGGTGFAFDELRPTGDYIRSSGGTTSGPISFWKAFSEATNAIQQGAFRRGANMGMMYIHHPDILKFLHAKEDLTQFTNYNISVKVTDEWMEGFLRDPDGPHVVRNPRNDLEFVLPRDLSIAKYDLRSLLPVKRGPSGELLVAEKHDESVAGQTGTAPVATRGSSELPVPVYTRRDIWNIIVRNAHRTGEPGVVFMDRINEFNPTPHVGRIEATNPCGEQPLLPYEACNLGSVNLGAFVTNPCTPQAAVDWDAMRECVQVSMRFLDNVIDANNYPLPEIEQMCKNNRKVGLGVMGFADALYKLNARYSSEEGIAWGERFMKFLNDEAHNYSEQLASQRGCFPNWQGSVWDTKYHRPMRNAASTTIAPTGTISIISGCSGGIEPLFSLAFFRNVLKGQDQGKPPMVEINPIFETMAREQGFYSEGLMDRIAKDGTLAHIDGVPENVKHVFVCAHDISPEWHVRMQAGFQAHCDASISKTINFPHDASVADVETIYQMAYKLRCKGVTVYRDGCRSEQPMALKDSEKRTSTSATPPQPAAAPAEAKAPESAREVKVKMGSDGSIEPRDIPEIVSGLRVRQMTPFGNMHVKITVDPRSGRELEVFAQLGKGGDLANSDLEAICRLISLWLRAGGSLNHVIRQLKDIGSSLQVATKEGKIKSLGDGLARALMKYRRAKDKFGLRELLLGEYDLSLLDKVDAGPNGNGNGKTNGNGNGSSNGNGHGRAAEVRHGAAGHGTTNEGPVPGTGTGLSYSPRMESARVEFKVKCPSCGEALVFSEGCNKCYDCGWAQC